jgi:putative tryptophan/tyrosine transport system substrate-binding protein
MADGVKRDGDGLGRRRHLTRRRLLAASALASPAFATRAQQKPAPVIGWLHTNAPENEVVEQAAFMHGVADHGFVEGQNVAIEYRWAHGEYDRLPALAADLVARQVAVIFAGPLNSTLAAEKATSSIPIVFNIGVDPVAFGLVASLNKPGGNLTGVAELLGELWPKRLQLLHELMPKAATMGVLVNPKNPNTNGNTQNLEAAAKSLGLALTFVPASSESEIEAAVAVIHQQKLEALFIGDDPYFRGLGGRLAALAMRYRIAAISFDRPFAASGGLMAFGPSFTATYRKAGHYTGRILKGAKPAELPVEQPTQFELVVNLRTAKMLGLNVPPSLLAGADEVIE